MWVGIEKRDELRSVRRPDDEKAGITIRVVAVSHYAVNL